MSRLFRNRDLGIAQLGERAIAAGLGPVIQGEYSSVNTATGEVIPNVPDRTLVLVDRILRRTDRILKRIEKRQKPQECDDAF